MSQPVQQYKDTFAQMWAKLFGPKPDWKEIARRIPQIPRDYPKIYGKDKT